MSKTLYPYPDEAGGGYSNDDDGSPGPRRLTLMRYAAFRIHYRPQEPGALLRGSRLFIRYVVNLFATID